MNYEVRKNEDGNKWISFYNGESLIKAQNVFWDLCEEFTSSWIQVVVNGWRIRNEVHRPTWDDIDYSGGIADNFYDIG
ncbi:MAG: hypothetical protein ACTSYR_06200 [Candidatus Odinarchaeia archaeon]